jgi:hypothetical protein
MGFGSTTLALAKYNVLRHFPGDLGCTKGIRHQTRREEGGVDPEEQILSD